MQLTKMKSFLDKIANTRLGFMLNYMVAMVELRVMRLYHDKKSMDLIEEVIKEAKPILMRSSELYFVYSLAKHQSAVPGEFAEVGVFKGSTAKLICEVKADKPLHLFDTFEGLPEVGAIDNKFKTGLFPASENDLKNKLSRYSNVHIYKGLFPETGEHIAGRKFAFVHLDVDLYQSTNDVLHFFYERVVPNGIILSHDYHTNGVRKAFTEFFVSKPENIIELPLSQCMVIKQ